MSEPETHTHEHRELGPARHLAFCIPGYSGAGNREDYLLVIRGTDVIWASNLELLELIFFLKEQAARSAAQRASIRFALLALLEKKLTRVVPNFKPRSRQDQCKHGLWRVVAGCKGRITSGRIIDRLQQSSDRYCSSIFLDPLPSLSKNDVCSLYTTTEIIGNILLLDSCRTTWLTVSRHQQHRRLQSTQYELNHASQHLADLVDVFSLNQVNSIRNTRGVILDLIFSLDHNLTTSKALDVLLEEAHIPYLCSAANSIL
ncbi:hypothetical protein J6590_023584 [Homalodisca vitripennis]|nr:hypothetical protein J6590_023584 [Homalodisca vitripennis]